MSEATVDADNTLSANGSQVSSELDVPEDPEFHMEPDSTFHDAMNKLDELHLEPDVDMTNSPTHHSGESELLNASSEAHKDNTKAENKSKQKSVTLNSEKEDGVNKPLSKSTKRPSILDRLKSLTKSDKKPKESLHSRSSTFKDIKIDKLPVCFVAKYIGHMETKGVFGLEHVRVPVDEFVSKVKDDLVSMDKVELPLCYLVFSSKGIDVSEHPANKVRDRVQYGLHPIDFISYGVQDMKYWRVFAFIVVKELGYKNKKTECHAYIADSPQSARRMALALAACFNVYKKKLNAEGKVHNFQVELRPPDELAGCYQSDVDA